MNSEGLDVMEKRQVGSLLQGVFSDPGTPVSDIMKNDGFKDILAALPHLDTTPQFLPLSMIIVPQVYRDRDDNRVDICGTIDEGSIEYRQGLRFYDSNGIFYYADGRRYEGIDHHADIVNAIDRVDIHRFDKPQTVYQWVHPQHSTLKSFFNDVVPGRSPVKIFHHYLNRMGFVVQLVKTDETSQNPFFTGDDGQDYSVDGRLLSLSEGETSTYDLVREIRNWPIFSQGDWSTDQPPGMGQADDNVPELFNPIENDRHALMAELLEIMMRANDISRRLGIDFGFHINSADGLGTQ